MTCEAPVMTTNLDENVTKLLYQLGLSIFESSYSENLSQVQDQIVCAIMQDASGDLIAYHQRDPSIRHKPITCLISQYSTYFAVLSYRIAHELITTVGAERDAIHISYAARSNTGTEIHPEAVIGRRFVVDHGWGTVVGQTTEIGDDCYLLNNVTLGGRSAANAPDGKRHPTLGDRVQVCAGANVFGSVHIGDDCFIGPNTTIIDDVPNNSTILIQRAQRPLALLKSDKKSEEVRLP